MTDKPKANNSQTGKELEQAEKQFEAYDKNIKEMTMDRMNKAPKEESEQQTQLSSEEISKAKDIYLKPTRSIAPGVKERFNERLRAKYEFDKEYVPFIAENKEIIGEAIEIWTKPYPGMAAEFWTVPTNKPIWGPRYLAEQIKRCTYHRLVMQQQVITETNHVGQMYGALAVDTVVQRLDAHPVSRKKSIFMGASSFA